MPISEYYGGHGTEVMRNMKSSYGAKKGKSVFYATENKHKGIGGISTKRTRGKKEKKKGLFSRV